MARGRTLTPSPLPESPPGGSDDLSEDDPTEETDPGADDGAPGILEMELEDELPLVLARTMSPRPRQTREEFPPPPDPLPGQAFDDAFAGLPGYRASLVIDRVTSSLVYAHGEKLGTPELIRAESEAWRSAYRIDPAVDELIAVTDRQIHIAMPAESTGRLFFVAICSKDDANIALVRLALQGLQA